MERLSKAVRRAKAMSRCNKSYCTDVSARRSHGLLSDSAAHFKKFGSVPKPIGSKPKSAAKTKI